MDHRRRTRILATLGPATDPPGVLDAILRAGVDVVRLNFSHGDPASQKARAQAVREAAARVGTEVGILADLPGPKIRIERFEQGRVQLRAGDRFDFVYKPGLIYEHIDLMLDNRCRQPIQKRCKFIITLAAIQGSPQMPVGGMQQFHWIGGSRFKKEDIVQHHDRVVAR